jgi:hypothetical protein
MAWSGEAQQPGDLLNRSSLAVGTLAHHWGHRRVTDLAHTILRQPLVNPSNVVNADA